MTNHNSDSGHRTFAQALEKAIAHSSMEVLNGETQLYSLVADYLGGSLHGKQSLNLLRNAIDCGIPTRMYGAVSKDTPTQTITAATCCKLLVDSYGISEEAAGRFMEGFVAALGWKVAIAPPPAPAPKKQTPPPAPSTTAVIPTPAPPSPAPKKKSPLPISSTAAVVTDTPAPMTAPAPVVISDMDPSGKPSWLGRLLGWLWSAILTMFLCVAGVLLVVAFCAAIIALVLWSLGKAPLDTWWWEMLRYFITGLCVYPPLWLVYFITTLFPSKTNTISKSANIFISFLYAPGDYIDFNIDFLDLYSSPLLVSILLAAGTTYLYWGSWVTVILHAVAVCTGAVLSFFFTIWLSEFF